MRGGLLQYVFLCYSITTSRLFQNEVLLCIFEFFIEKMRMQNAHRRLLDKHTVTNRTFEALLL